MLTIERGLRPERSFTGPLGRVFAAMLDLPARAQTIDPIALAAGSASLPSAV